MLQYLGAAHTVSLLNGATYYVIRSFKHKGLLRFFTEGSSQGVQADHIKRLRIMLAQLDSAENLKALDLPGLRLHPLKGRLYGFYSLAISGNWRLVFRFSNGDVFEVDYLDYH